MLLPDPVLGSILMGDKTKPGWIFLVFVEGQYSLIETDLGSNLRSTIFQMRTWASYLVSLGCFLIYIVWSHTK